MALSHVHSRSLLGLDAPLVTVEVHLANGLPSFTLVGLADVEVKESRERVRAALQNCGFEFPHNKRITVNLAPADLPKEGGRFDLPIALGILSASEQIDPVKLARYEFAGELSLAGELRPVRGALAMALAMRRAHVAAEPARALVLPSESAQEAAHVEGLKVYAARHLMDVVTALLPDPDKPVRGVAEGALVASNDEAGAGACAKPVGEAAPKAARTVWAEAGHAETMSRAVAVRRPATSGGPDLADVRGQSAAKRALEIAACGAHSVLLVGPPGTGKSMLADRFAGLLPPLSEDEALESAAVLSLTGHFRAEHWGRRMMRAPHHSASSVALVGGGSPPRPGEISLAHHGVLYLDEMPEFPRAALEALREPLENGRIVISRAARQDEFPAKFQLIGAMNPCPCGHHGSPLRPCRCSPDVIARYQGKLSGPLLDRIDLQVEVPAVPMRALAAASSGESSAVVAERVAAARLVQTRRQGVANAALDNAGTALHCALDAPAVEFLQQAATRLGWSARSYHRVQRIARTIADLAGSAPVTTTHVAEAIGYRRALKAE